MNAEFDRHAHGYEEAHRKSVAAYGEDTTYFAEYKAADARRIFADRSKVPHILDFGTGVGGLIPHLKREFPRARLTGVDVSSESLAIAQSRYGDAASFLLGDDVSIPLDAGSIDIAIVSCVMHHLKSHQRVTALTELRRVLVPAGLLMIFEHNPWNPLTLRAVRQCAFDANAELVSLPRMLKLVRSNGFSNSNWEFRLFFPAALARLRHFEPGLSRRPIGAQYLVAARS
jgi:ubiquinone/menaquinone biosynthesis C-methylase UbiE